MHRKDMIQMIVVIAVLVLAFFLGQKYLFPDKSPPPAPNTAGNNAPAANEAPANKPEPPKIEDTTPSTEVQAKPTAKDEAYGFKVISPDQAETFKLANERLTAEFSTRGAVLTHLTYIDADGNVVYQHTPDNPVDEPKKALELLHPVEEMPDLLPFAMVLDKNDDWRNTSRWELVKDAPQPEKGKSLTFRFPPSSGFKNHHESDGTVIYKTFTLLPETYRFDITVRIENESGQPAEKVVGLWGPVGVTEDAARNSGEHSRIALYGSTDSKRFIQLEDSPRMHAIHGDVDDLNAELKEAGEEVHDWVSARKLDDVTADDRFLVVHGVRTQWFLAFLAADPDNRDQRWSGQVLPIKDNDQNAAMSLIAPKMTVPAEGKAEVKMRFYAGPRDKDRLRDAWLANPPADEEIKLQWAELATSGFWDVIATPMIWILRTLTSLIGPGLAIILLTLIVRFSLSPLSYRGQKSMATYTQKMKVVKPKLDAIKEKYEGKKGQDAQLKMLTETREVMKENNVGMLPLGGCLPMLIQLPIFIGLYRAFGNAFFLRQAHFLWIHDLSMPDATLPVSTYLGDSWLGFLAHNGWLTFNILPMLWITLSLVQFKLQPKPDDPQQASMQKQMGFLFPLMGLMFYGYASGFAFYFIISSLYSITESRLVKRALIKQGVMPDPKKKPKVEEDDKPDYHGAS
ncbi:MAG: YidC/Oxa1 family insertase periplasmic-domain containing protein [Planctomycetes bacterium]|nr:YidC/Oxa1 family insertase periplasmic-domain containing protein [Planctomycetota bacterium]